MKTFVIARQRSSSKSAFYISYLLWYTLMFALVSIGVFFWFLLYQKSLCWETDTSSQYIPKAVYFIQYMRDAVKRALTGDFTFKMYDFSIGFGDSVPLHTEPVYWLYMLFDKRI